MSDRRVRAIPAGLALAFAFTGPAALAEHGLASWYGGSFHGQLAASGEIYDAEALTAAHRTLPFGTNVRVQRLDGGSSVVVRINDRGPYSGARIIDVSAAAARQLGMTDPGVVRVAVEVVDSAAGPEDAPAPQPAPAIEPDFAVQAGTFRNPENARRMRIALESIYGSARIVTRRKAPGLLCVVVGQGLTQSEAQALAAKIRAARKENAGAYAIRMEPASFQIAD